MKTKFTINKEIFLDNGTLTECFELYENHYKQLGFILDKEEETVYMMFNKEIQLNEGDRVVLYGCYTVDWKGVDVIKDIIEYALIPE